MSAPARRKDWRSIRNRAAIGTEEVFEGAKIADARSKLLTKSTPVPIESATNVDDTGSAEVEAPTESGATLEPAPDVATRPTSPRSNSKLALHLKMLSHEGGASIEELMTATTWLPHTTRAPLTGLKKARLRNRVKPQGPCDSISASGFLDRWASRGNRIEGCREWRRPRTTFRRSSRPIGWGRPRKSLLPMLAQLRADWTAKAMAMHHSKPAKAKA
jgi:hypothetical protein